jgi:F-type H+-transporting ATPase subunit alpha
VLKQPQYQPMPVEEQVAIIWVATNGYLDDVLVEHVREFERQYLDYLRTSHPEILRRIAEERELKEDLIEQMRAVVQEFKRAIWTPPRERVLV